MNLLMRKSAPHLFVIPVLGLLLRRGAVLLCSATLLYGQSLRHDSPTASAQVVVPPGLQGSAAGWKKTFTDDFDGKTLGKCWKNSYEGDVHTLAGNAEQEWYTSPGTAESFNPFHLANGIFSIEAVEVARTRAPPHITSDIIQA